jgi:predicted MFS family arabinose efflux permease
VLHGLVYFILLKLLLPRVRPLWRLSLAIAFAALWELLENTNLVIERYRAATAALGYTGDTVVNSLGDILCCALGFMIARAFGWRRSVILFVVTETVLLFWIRDGLILNIIMLIHPIQAIRAWQMC